MALKLIYEAISDVSKPGSKENALVGSLLAKHGCSLLDTTFQMKLPGVGKSTDNCVCWTGRYLSGYIVMSDAIPVGVFLTKAELDLFNPSECDGIYVPLVAASLSAILSKLFPFLDGKMRFSVDAIYASMEAMTESEYVEMGSRLLNEGWLEDKGWTAETWDNENLKELNDKLIKLRYDTGWTKAGGYTSWEELQTKRAWKGKSEKDYKNAINDIDAIVKFKEEIKGLSKPAAKTASVKVTSDPLDILMDKGYDKVDYEQQFTEFEDQIARLCDGDVIGVISVGAPGLGKTFRMNKILKKKGKKEGDNMYTLSGKASNRELYKILWSFSNYDDVVVIDDCNSLIESNSDGAELIKAATDSSKNIVSWISGSKITADVSTVTRKPLTVEEARAGVEAETIELPKSFEFNGSIIILTNMAVNKIDQAIMSRFEYCPFDLSKEDRIALIDEIIGYGIQAGGRAFRGESMPQEYTKMVFEYLLKYIDEHPKVSIDDLTPRTVAVLATTYYREWLDGNSKALWEKGWLLRVQNALRKMAAAKKVNYV